jgi:hypothetical protein
MQNPYPIIINSILGYRKIVMTKSKKTFLVFIAFALSSVLISLSELFFPDHLTPFKLILPLVVTLPVYSVLIYRTNSKKTAGNY